MNFLQHTRNELNLCLKQNRPDRSYRDTLLNGIKKVKHVCMKCRKEIFNNTGDSKKASTLWHTGYPVCSCVLLMIYRAEC